jgi:hypothetical protein
MADNNQIDEIALNTLLADGVDAPTALAASYRPQPSEPQPARTTDRTFTILALGGLVAFIVWLWLR